MKRTVSKRLSAAIGIMGLAAVLTSGVATAHIVYLTDGTVLKGIVEEGRPDSPSVRFTGSAGSMQIPRTRIRSIEPEPIAVGYVHIGDDHQAKGNLEAALRAFEQALREDTSLQLARDKIDQVREALSQREKAARQDDLTRIDETMGESRRLMREGQFAEAETLIQSADRLRPTAEQRQELQRLLADLYVAWAEERQDKLDAGGAEWRLDLALGADPDREDVVKRMLALWEGQTDKREQTLRIYETLLARNPEDPQLIRKVADLHYDLGHVEDSTLYYLELYRESDRFRGGEMEKRIVNNLNLLHQRFARNQDFDHAIELYHLMAYLDPTADPSVPVYYEYLKRAGSTGPEDVAGRLVLALFCERNGLDEDALQEYRRVLALDPENAEAKAALNRFAMKLVEDAQVSFNQRLYAQAESLAATVPEQYPEAEEARLRAAEIFNRARTEIARDQRDAREKALVYIEQGNRAYEQALVFYRDVFDLERRGSAPVSTPRSDAIRHFRYAIQAYETALKLDPSLARDPTSPVLTRLNDARNYLARLTQPPPRVGLLPSNRPLR